ncbi:hypothetical protein F4815DRAFT_442799 [Daldinia loculata]|nr:hypothetical protein F4815DRAFT_442799 [Daldinia loculata]
MDNFVWCPLGCGKGQIHHPGEISPMVFCLRDKRYFCFRHGTVWHRDLTCEQYDAFLADPQSFSRKVQTQTNTQGEQDKTPESVNWTTRPLERFFAERKAKQKRRQEIQQHKDRLRAEEAATARVIKHCPKCTVEIFKDGGW